MFNYSRTLSFLTIIFVALTICIWTYNRSRPFGKLGIVSWLQSVALLTPWLIFFSLLSLGVYLNLVAILLLLVLSIAIYIILGRSLRDLGKENYRTFSSKIAKTRKIN